MSIFAKVMPVVEPEAETPEQERARRMHDLLDELHAIDARLQELQTIAAEPTRLARRREMVLAEFAVLKGGKNV
jgi:aminoglycoside phosphotransferase (APT) family kinase protein